MESPLFMWMIWLRLVIFDQFEIAMGLFLRFSAHLESCLAGSFEDSGHCSTNVSQWLCFRDSPQPFSRCGRGRSGAFLAPGSRQKRAGPGEGRRAASPDGGSAPRFLSQESAD